MAESAHDGPTANAADLYQAESMPEQAEDPGFEGDGDDFLMEGAELDDPPPSDAPVRPYVFNADEVPGAAQVLDVAFGTLITGWDGWTAVEDAVKWQEPTLDEACQRALVQLAIRPLKLLRNGRTGSDLSDGEIGASVAAVRAVNPEEVRLWEALVPRVTSHAALAKVSDLLFVRRSGDVGSHGRRAVKAYLDAVAGRPDDLDTTTYLLRAWTLSRLLRDSRLEREVVSEIEVRVDSLITGGGLSRPGVLYPLVNSLCEKPLDAGAAQAHGEHAESVLRTLAAGEARGHLASQIASIRRKLIGGSATAEQVAAIDADEVAAYIREAEAANHPAARMSHLEKAARVATRRGRSADVRDITAKMQAIRPEDLGLQVISATSKLPEWVPESYLQNFTRQQDWQTAISRFMLDPDPPTGSVAEIRSAAASTRSPLRGLFPPVLLEDGLPRATLRTEPEQDRHEMAFVARVRAEYMGRLLALALTRIAEEYGRPDLDELTNLILDHGAADPRLARSLAKGFHYFWAGDYEAAVAIVVPKIEAAARSLLRALDEGIYQVQVSRDPGGYPGLYVLLNELESLALDEDWAWFLRWLLLGPIGQNVRNDVAHGFVSDLRPEYVALVLRAAAILITAAPVADDLGRHVDVLPQLESPTRLARLADRTLAAVSAVGMRITGLGAAMRLRLRTATRTSTRGQRS